MTSKTTNGITVEYTYDALGRISQQVTKNGSTVILTETYTYVPNSSRIASCRTVAANYDVTYSYTYDDNGNILSVNDGTNTTSYVYDTANQLVRENNQAGGFTHVWVYDDAGNILSNTEYAYTTGELGTPAYVAEYSYGDSDWGDLLTVYDTDPLQYDAIGNIIDDCSWQYTWEHGRELVSMTTGIKTWSFTYDANGMRTKRTNGTNTYTYVYNGSQLVQMTVDGHTLSFTYDAAGTPVTLTADGTVYYYLTNLQGDVTGILNANGERELLYEYDAWGKILYTNDCDDVLAYNPLRYRGYVFDQETNLYYLQSRYYDPVVGRFLNADGMVSTGQGLLGNNMFAYCYNRPVICADKNGRDAIILVDTSGVTHIGVLAQDANGQWWHYYWGSGAIATENTSSAPVASSSGAIITIISDVPAKTWCEPYSGDLTLDAINSSGQYSGYDDMLHLQGDFSECIESMKNSKPKYNLYKRNCSQMSLKILSSANTNYSWILKAASSVFIPSHAFDIIESYISLTKRIDYLIAQYKRFHPWKYRKEGAS